MRLLKRLPGAAFGLLAGACASNAVPAVLPAAFAPPDGNSAWAWSPRRNEQPPAPCRIAFTEVRDTRVDPLFMGDMAGRPVRAEDPVAWLKSGLASLSADKRLTLVDAADPAGHHLGLKAELVKAYIESLRINKSANVVVRVTYTLNGANWGEPSSFRGADDGMNFGSLDSEAYEVLNRAMQEVIAALDKDLLVRCEAARKTPAPAAAAGAQ